MSTVTDDFSIVAKVAYASQLFSHLSIGFTKVSVVLLYRRLFYSATINRIVNALFLIVGLWIITFFVAIAFQCSPVSRLWEMTATERAPYCVSIVLLENAYTASDLLINIMVLCLLVSLISSLLSGRSTKQKYAVGGIFALGVLVCVTSLARMILSFQSQQGTDIIFDSAPLAAWSLAEASLGIVVACLLNLAPIFTKSTPSGGFIGHTISSPIASSKITPRMSGWAYLILQNKAETKDPFDDRNSLIISKAPRVSLKELEFRIRADKPPYPRCTRELIASSLALVLRADEAQIEDLALP